MKIHQQLISNVIKRKDFAKKLNDSANKRQVKHISSSLETSFPIHSLVNMVDSEDIILETIKTLSWELENFLL